MASRERTSAGTRTTPGIVSLSAWVGAFLVYLVWYFSAAMPSLPPHDGQPWRRSELLAFFFAPDALYANWFEESFTPHLLDRAPILATALFVELWAVAVGWLLLRGLGLTRELTRLEVIVYAAAVGLNAISLFVLMVGLAGELSNRLVFLLPAAASIIAAGALILRSLRAHRNPSIAYHAHVASDSRPAASPWWLLAAAPFLLVTILGGMLPSVDFDVREYHLEAPKEFYQAGRIGFLAHNVYGNMALGTEMLSLLGMVLLGDWWQGAIVGKTLIALYVPLTVLAIYAAGRRWFSPLAAVVAAVVYASIPWILRVSMSGLVEGASAFYLFCAVTSVAMWSSAAIKGEPTQQRLAMLAGFLAGSAVACKYPAALFVLAPLTAWVIVVPWVARWYGSESDGAARLVKRLGVFLLAATVACGPWFAKNWVLAGNPTYPLLYDVFGGHGRTADLNAHWQEAHSPHGHSAASLVSSIEDVLGRSDWTSLLVIPLAVLALLSVRQRPLVAGLFVYSLWVILAWWMWTHRIDRFWIPLFPVLALLAGAGAAWRADRAWRITLTGAMTIGLSFCFILSTVGGPGAYHRFFISLDSARHDPLRVPEWHRYLNRLSPKPAGVLSVGDAEVFDLDVPVRYNTAFDASLLRQFVEHHSPAETLRLLEDAQISSIYVNWGEIERYRSAGNYGYSDFERPEVFRKLVGAGVLGEPKVFNEGRVEIYPVLRRPRSGG